MWEGSRDLRRNHHPFRTVPAQTGIRVPHRSWLPLPPAVNHGCEGLSSRSLQRVPHPPALQKLHEMAPLFLLDHHPQFVLHIIACGCDVLRTAANFHFFFGLSAHF